MTPITSILGFVAHKPAAVATAAQGFGAHLDAALGPAPDVPDRATVGHMHAGGLNDVAHRMQALATALQK